MEPLINRFIQKSNCHKLAVYNTVALSQQRRTEMIDFHDFKLVNFLDFFCILRFYIILARVTTNLLSLQVEKRDNKVKINDIFRK